jgi:hypothetical protein
MAAILNFTALSGISHNQANWQTKGIMTETILLMKILKLAM